MDVLDRIITRVAPSSNREVARQTRRWPVGYGEVFPWETTWGHDDARWSPDDPEAENYATANDVYSLASSRARLMSGLDLRFYQGSGTKKKLVEKGRAHDLYHWVNPFWSNRRLAYMDEMSMCIWGETYWALEPPSRNSPLGEIWWLKPSRVKPAPHPSGYLAGFWYESTVGDRIFFTTDEVVWFRYPNPLDEMSALSPLVAAKLAIDAGLAMMKANRNLFHEGLQIRGLITPSDKDVEFTVDQVDDIEWYLKRKFSGPDKANRWAVLRKEMQFKELQMSPHDAEWVAGLNMTFRQVCRVFGLQAPLHNDLEQSSPGDTDSLERIEWARTLKPDAMLRAEEIKEQYLPKFAAEFRSPDHCEFDFSQVPALQESASEVWGRDAQMLDRGLITINEWREKNGLPPVPWGDAPWLPMNKGQFLPADEEPKGKLVIPGQPPGMMQQGMSQAAMQGGPQPVDQNGVPLEKPPDDEVNPVNQPDLFVDHNQARALIAAFVRQPKAINGRAQ